MKATLPLLLLAAPVHAQEICHADFRDGTPPKWSVEVPEGNYDVTLTFGGKDATDTTVRAEARRLVLPNFKTEAGKTATRTFTVNMRTPALPDGKRVKTNAREKDHLDWNTTLDLSFTGSHPGVTAVEVKPRADALTVFIAGDSTVTDQQNEPYSAWGQILPMFFQPGTAIANIAESGLALRSFRSQLRLEKILSQLKKGDYVLIQFAHNDEKEKGEGVGAFTTYKADLEDYVTKIREKGGQPVLMTPMFRRRFDKDNRLQDSHGDYPVAVRRVAEEKKVPLVDLHRHSESLFSALGPDGTTKAFVHYPANTYPGQTQALSDDTHFNTYGAWLLAKCVVEGIRKDVPDLAKRLTPGLPVFDPAKPDQPGSWSVPPSPPPSSVEVPAGS
ncbi:rhamnogalacturonan acetylesterase [Luteolibacter ambystomatis]|uniref:Rhamnogalacturonan acetylesterase n=1 Tax=Luteolibacter ambystomatis TaxID=2824561 RepID=A0A975PF65_9BACT|nr:rhamnogalacturonan acetylesterase [Luteolibacter ambystomatis]QUE51848.1 rhamnogalacturonan acetylesterase [Luteolibacter ambystomatis]